MTFDYESYAARYDNEKDFDRYLLKYKCNELWKYRENLGDTLELGCATGLMTEWVFPNTASLDVVDASEEQVLFTAERIRRAFPEEYTRASFHHSFFENFKPSKKYDTILLAGVLPALKDPIAFLKTISSWLTPGGFIFITSHNGLSLHRRVGKAMEIVKDATELSARDREMFNHQLVYTFDTLRADVEASGLEVAHHAGVFLKPFPNAKMLELSEDMIEGFYKVGFEVDPRLCAETVICAVKK